MSSYRFSMSTVAEILEAAKHLSASERIALVEAVWETVASEVPESVRLSDEQESELDRRLDRIEREGVQGIESELRKELLGRACTA
jgi:putative addiction module component (TIGR02574 family)